MYAGSDDIEEVAWYYGNSDTDNGRETHGVGQKKGNGFGLYDMSGNVLEWVWDSWRDYKSSSVIDPVYVDTLSSVRVLRGGSWDSDARDTRVSRRGRLDASLHFYSLGFRFLRSIP